MFDDTKLRSESLPEELRVLLNTYPREQWPDHPNFRDATKNWMGAHQMFLKLADVTIRQTEHFLDRNHPAIAFVNELLYYGDALVNNLHGHHGWEDRVYFPELSAADPRFDRGLQILENDHRLLDEALEHFADDANAVISTVRANGDAKPDAEKFRISAERIKTILDRHLQDEEDLAVPIILHHKLRG